LLTITAAALLTSYLAGASASIATPPTPDSDEPQLTSSDDRGAPLRIPPESIAAPVERGSDEQPVTSSDSTDDRVRIVVDIGALALLSWFEAAANPPNCKWCDRDASGADTLNGFDRAARNALLWAPNNRKRADTLSTVFEWSMIIGGGIFSSLKTTSGASTAHEQWAAISLFSEALAVDAGLTGVIKRAAARERPFVHFQDPYAAPGELNESFLSGHTSHAFAVATSLGYICHLYHCGHEKLTWLIGLGAATYTGYLRVAADKHYMTDVLAGAGLGSLSGLAVPALSARTWKVGRAQAVIAPAIAQGRVGLRSSWAW
jgi:membrane-associated phospholipid phosphatase